MKKKLILWTLWTLSILGLLLSNVNADNFNIDNMLNSLNTTDTWNSLNTTDTWNIVNTWWDEKINVSLLKNKDWNYWNKYLIKNWNKDYLLQFKVSKDIKLTNNLIKVINPNTNQEIPKIYEDNLRVFNDWDTLKSWNNYYIELWGNYKEITTEHKDNVIFTKILRKVNWSLDTNTNQVIYNFYYIPWEKNLAQGEIQTWDIITWNTIKTKVIKNKKTGLNENLLLFAFVLLLWSLYYKRKI